MTAKTRRLMAILVMAFVLFGFIQATQATEYKENVVNGNFESGLTGWDNLEAQSFIQTNQAHTPTHSVYSYGDGAGFYQFTPVDASSVSSFTFYVYGQGSNNDAMTVTFADDSYVSSFRDDSWGSTDFFYPSWVKVDATAILSGVNKQIAYISFNSGTRNAVYVDDVSLVTKSVPVAPVHPNYFIWIIYAIITAGFCTLAILIFNASQRNSRGK